MTGCLKFIILQSLIISCSCWIHAKLKSYNLIIVNAWWTSKFADLFPYFLRSPPCRSFWLFVDIVVANGPWRNVVVLWCSVHIRTHTVLCRPLLCIQTLVCILWAYIVRLSFDQNITPQPLALSKVALLKKRVLHSSRFSTRLHFFCN